MEYGRSLDVIYVDYGCYSNTGCTVPGYACTVPGYSGIQTVGVPGVPYLPPRPDGGHFSMMFEHGPRAELHPAMTEPIWTPVYGNTVYRPDTNYRLSDGIRQYSSGPMPGPSSRGFMSSELTGFRSPELRGIQSSEICGWGAGSPLTGFRSPELPGFQSPEMCGWGAGSPPGMESYGPYFIQQRNSADDRLLRMEVKHEYDSEEEPGKLLVPLLRSLILRL